MGGLKEVHGQMESQVVAAIEATHIHPQRLKELSVRLGMAVEPDDEPDVAAGMEQVRTLRPLPATITLNLSRL